MVRSGSLKILFELAGMVIDQVTNCSIVIHILYVLFSKWLDILLSGWESELNSEKYGIDYQRKLVAISYYGSCI